MNFQLGFSPSPILHCFYYMFTRILIRDAYQSQPNFACTFARMCRMQVSMF